MQNVFVKDIVVSFLEIKQIVLYGRWLRRNLGHVSLNKNQAALLPLFPCLLHLFAARLLQGLLQAIRSPWVCWKYGWGRLGLTAVIHLLCLYLYRMQIYAPIYHSWCIRISTYILHAQTQALRHNTHAHIYMYKKKCTCMYAACMVFPPLLQQVMADTLARLFQSRVLGRNTKWKRTRT